MPGGIAHIEIRRFLPQNHWHSPRSGFPPHLVREHIQDRLDAKEAKPSKFENEYASIWLLLVTGTEGMSSWAIAPPELQVEEFTSSYDRVFVVIPGVSAFELQMRRVA
jgi:hypothetical protein